MYHFPVVPTQGAILEKGKYKRKKKLQVFSNNSIFRQGFFAKVRLATKKFLLNFFTFLIKEYPIKYSRASLKRRLVYKASKPPSRTAEVNFGFVHDGGLRPKSNFIDKIQQNGLPMGPPKNWVWNVYFFVSSSIQNIKIVDLKYRLHPVRDIYYLDQIVSLQFFFEVGKHVSEGIVVTVAFEPV